MTRFQSIGAAVVLAVSLLSFNAAGQQSDIKTVPVNVMKFRLHDDGVLEPESWREGNWWDLRPATETEQREAIQEQHIDKGSRTEGRVAVTGLDSNGDIVYRSIADVAIAERLESGEVTPIHDPLFIVVVPRTAQHVTLEGWLPATHTRFDIRDIEARFAPSSRTRQRPTSNSTQGRIETFSNRINILIMGDGYLAADEPQFNADVAAFETRFFNTEPFRRYHSFFVLRRHFVASAVRGAYGGFYHPAPCPPPPGGENDYLSYGNAFKSHYCPRLTTDSNAVLSEVADAVDGQPQLVLILVNDRLPDGTNGHGRYPTVAVGYGATPPSAAAFAPITALHEIGHDDHLVTPMGLGDEYSTSDEHPGSVGVAVCPTGTPCYPNLMRSESNTEPPNPLSWSRWIEHLPGPVCQASGPAGAQCGDLGIGAYQGGAHDWQHLWHPESSCIMNDQTIASRFCHICTDALIRGFYEHVNPVLNILSTNRLYKSGSSGTPLPPPAQPGDVLDLGVIGPETLGDVFSPQWVVDGLLQPTHSAILRYTVPAPSSSEPSVHRIKLILNDMTDMLRVDDQHRRPAHMFQSFVWLVMVESKAIATSTGAGLSSAVKTITVEQGTQFVNLRYSLNTSEPGGRRGDPWTITAAYAGNHASELTASSNLFFKEGTAFSSENNFISSVQTIPVGEATRNGPATIAVEVTVKNGETGDGEAERFIPTTVTASVYPQPTGCGDSCAACETNPSDPNCPLDLPISATALPIPSTDQTANQGDSTYSSIGERIHLGRYTLIQFPTSFPKNSIRSIRFQVDALRSLDDFVLSPIRDTTWYRLEGANEQKGVFDLPNMVWRLNISPKVQYVIDGITISPVPESQWTHLMKYRITATVTLNDDRVTVSTTDIDSIISGSTPSDPVLLRRPLHALWHTPYTDAVWQFWASLYMHNWMKSPRFQLHTADRIADEDAVDFTPRGHEFANGVTELPFYEGAARYGNDFYKYSYGDFRSDANKALDSNTNASTREAARLKVYNWLYKTREHLQIVLNDPAVSEVRIGDGGKCGGSVSDHLPDGWMKTLLLGGKIVDGNGSVLLDMSSYITGQWSPPFIEHLTFSCTDNSDIDILVDRCRIGEIPFGPCSTGRTIIRRTSITVPPVSVSVSPGQPASFSVVADGENLRYQWYQGPLYTYNTPLGGETSDHLTVTPPESMFYWVLVTGDDGAIGAGASATVVGTDPPCTDPPSITQQPPFDQTISSNQAAFLAVTATGSNRHYQWYSYDPDGNPPMIDGATLSSYTTTNPGAYFVRVSNTCGSVDSDPSYVLFGSHCIVPSALQYGATSTNITLGESTTLGLFPEGPPPITVTWYEISPDVGYPVPIGDGTSITVTPAVDEMQYQAILQNDCGTRETQPITIHVCTPVVITQQPVPPPPFVNNGQSATLHVEATGSNLHYHWTAGGAPYGTDSPDLTITPQPGPVYYACRVDNECSHADSNEILVAPPCPQLTASVLPESGSLASGQSLTLEVTTTGEGALTYQWSQKLPGASAFTDIAGATGTSLVVSPTVDQTQYRVHVSNGCGSADSNAATITVTPCLPAAIVSTTGDSVTLGQASTVSVSATGTDLHYAWFAGNPPDTSNPLATTTPALTLTLNNPATYWVRVTALCGPAANSGPIAVHVCTTPSITTPPQSTSVFSGGSATLSVSANEGTGEPMHYQWFKGVSSPGAVGTDSASYTTDALTSDTQYWVRVTAGSCSADSSAATVSICPLPQSVSGAPNQNTTYGQSVRLQLGALPGATGYAWYRGSSGDTSFPLSGGFQAANYFDVDPQVTTSYWAQVQNGSCVSNTTTTTVNVCIPTITTPPASIMVNSGQSATLSVAANTTGLTYQWYLGTSPSTMSPISGATGSSLTVSPSSTSSYWVRVTGSCGVAVNSTTAVVTICAPPAVTTPPQGASIVRGQSVTLSVTASGTNLTYQWYQGPSGNTTIPLASTSTSISVTPQNPTDYWVKVTGSCGVVNSVAAHVSVCMTPSISVPPQNTSVFSGSAATLSVTASEATSEPMHYQWFKGVSSPVAICSDSATCNTGALTTQTQFWVRVTAGSCPVDSAAATVSICPLAASVAGPPNANSSPNQTVRLQFGALPGATGYAWFRGNSGDTSFPLSGGFQSANYFDVSPSVTTNYWAQAQNGSCVSNSTTTTVSVCIPTIASQPSGSTITSGSPATLSVSSSLGGSTYQWYVGASGTTTSPVSGATSASLTVSPTSTTTYWCRVSGSCGFANSNAATITVCSPPQITQQPVNASPSQRNFPTGLGVTATGTNLTYQWYLGASGDTSQPISGQTGATFSVNAVNSERYWVRVSGMCGSVNSNAAWVSVYPVMVQQPQAVSMSYGSTATFTVQASGTYLHYTWRESNGQLASGGTDSPTYRTGSIYASTAFYCDITSSIATTASNTVNATICDGPGIVSMPVTNAGSCRNIVVNSDRPIDNYLWYQGPRGNTSTLVSQGANEYFACPATSTTYWCRLVTGSCYTDSPAITVP
jgi:Ig-like domain-containing protein